MKAMTLLFIIMTTTQFSLAGELFPYELPSMRTGCERKDDGQLQPYELPSQRAARRNCIQSHQNNSVEQYYNDFRIKVEALNQNERDQLTKSFKKKRKASNSAEEFRHYDRILKIIRKVSLGR